jgi:hypothetical protein
MKIITEEPRKSQRFAFLKQQEEQVFLALTLLIGALVGATVVAFIVLTENVGARLHPASGSAWQGVLVIPASKTSVAGRMPDGATRDRIGVSEFRAWPVRSQVGVIGLVCLEALQENGEATLALSDLIEGQEFAHVHPDHSLNLALERMGATGLDVAGC